MVRILYITLVLVAIFDLSNNWRTDRRPRVFGEKISNRMLNPRLRRVQKRLVMLHDYFRTKVIPPASNMLTMKWHRGAARSAQKWAERCHFLIHDSPDGRHIHNFGSCGQNIFVSTHKVPWLFAMKTWFLERQNFTYGSDMNNLKEIGHYTQMVWAATHKVGCGIAKCKNGPHGKPFFNYICNYCPIGNYEDRIGYPYKVGKPCGSCSNHCRSKKVRLCTNVCNAVDVWANCRELYKTWAGWLCNDATPEGLERRTNCAATCTCHGRIHD